MTFSAVFIVIALSSLALVASFTRPISKIHFIYDGNVSDFGYNYSIEKSRIELFDDYESKGIHFYGTYNHSIPIYDIPKVVEWASINNYNLVVFTSNTFTSTVIASAPRFPNLHFICPSTSSSKILPSNVHALNLITHNGRYIAGYICGLITKSRKIGIILPFPKIIPSILGINAFILGAQNSTGIGNAEVGVSFVDSYDSPLASQRSVASLKSWGADCIHGVQNTPALWKYASSLKLPSIGYSTDMRISVGEYILTSTSSVWTVPLRKILDILVAGNWTSIGGTTSYEPETLRMFPFGFHMPRKLRNNVTDAVRRAPQVASFYTDQNCRDLQISPSICQTYLGEFNPNLNVISPLATIVSNWTELGVLKFSYWRIDSSFSISMMVICAVLILLYIYLIIHVIVYRKSHIYQSSSINFLLGLLVAALISCISCFFLLGKPNSLGCILYRTFFSIGNNLILACVLAKLWKFRRWAKNGYSLVNKANLPLFTLSNFELFFLFLTPLLLLQGVFMSIWTTFDPPKPYYLPSKNDAATFIMGCTPGHPKIVYVTTSYRVIIHAVTFVMCWMSRNTSLLATDVERLIYASTNQVFLSGLAQILIIMIRNGKAEVLFEVVHTILYSLGYILLLVLPKWYNVQILGMKGGFEDDQEAPGYSSSYYSRSGLSSAHSADRKFGNKYQDYSIDTMDPDAGPLYYSDSSEQISTSESPSNNMESQISMSESPSNNATSQISMSESLSNNTTSQISEIPSNTISDS